MSRSETKDTIMKTIAIALLAAAGFAASSARAEHASRVTVSGFINFGAPAVVTAPAYCPPPAPAPVVVYPPARGYWKDVVVRDWMPERWILRHNAWGRPVRVYEPGHYVVRTERVWVDGFARHGEYRDRGYDGYRHDWHG
jgi:hypothetical protein